MVDKKVQEILKQSKERVTVTPNGVTNLSFSAE